MLGITFLIIQGFKYLYDHSVAKQVERINNSPIYIA